MQSVSLASLMALVFAGSAPALGVMSTTNDMPVAEAAFCENNLCGQGALLTQSMIHYNGGDSSIAFVAGSDFTSSPGWAAGQELSVANFKDFYKHGDQVCKLQLRGVTILRILQADVASAHFLDTHGAVAARLALQFSGLRVTYSTTLPADGRLVKVEWWDKDAGAYADFDRTKVFGVAVFTVDAVMASPYNSWWNNPRLDGESADCSATFEDPGAVVEKFMAVSSPWTVPQMPSSRAVAVEGGTAIVVDENAAFCKTLSPPQFYDTAVYSCVACPAGEVADSAGTACTAAPTGVPTPTAPGGGPAADSATISPASAATTGAPGAVRSAAGSGAARVPLGAIVGSVAGMLALVVAAAAAVLFRRRQAGRPAVEAGLDSRRPPTDEKFEMEAVAA